MTTWTNDYKNPIDFLLLENGDQILQESGYFFILEQTGRSSTTWTFDTKH